MLWNILIFFTLLFWNVYFWRALWPPQDGTISTHLSNLPHSTWRNNASRPCQWFPTFSTWRPNQPTLVELRSLSWGRPWPSQDGAAHVTSYLLRRKKKNRYFCDTFRLCRKSTPEVDLGKAKGSINLGPGHPGGPPWTGEKSLWRWRRPLWVWAIRGGPYPHFGEPQVHIRLLHLTGQIHPPSWGLAALQTMP